MNAMPKADIGTPNQDPAVPTATPSPNTAAFRPPSSPALIASAAATPGGHAPEAGNTELSNIRYSRNPSSSIATATPANIGRIRSPRPSTNGMPIGSSKLLAAPNVAAEIALCDRFCTCTDR